MSCAPRVWALDQAEQAEFVTAASEGLPGSVMERTGEL